MAIVLSDNKILDGGGKQIQGENGERRQGLTTVAVVLSKKKNFDDEGKQVRGEKKGESRQSLTTYSSCPSYARDTSKRWVRNGLCLRSFLGSCPIVYGWYTEFGR